MVCKSFYNTQYEISLYLRHFLVEGALLSKALKHRKCFTFYALVYSQRAVQEKRKDL